MAALERDGDGDGGAVGALLALDCVHGPRQDPARQPQAAARDAGAGAGASPGTLHVLAGT
jgi:hypothetical protein